MTVTLVSNDQSLGSQGQKTGMIEIALFDLSAVFNAFIVLFAFIVVLLHL